MSLIIFHVILFVDTTAMYLPTDQQADSVWTQLQSTVDTALHLPYDTVLLPLNLPQNPPDLPQLAAPSPPSFPTPTLSPTPPHSSPKPRKPRTYIPDIHALPVYKEVRHTQRVYAWKENATMLFPTSFQSQNLVLGKYMCVYVAGVYAETE
ncbi:hypothetical protein EON65_32705 [archaeon]|nr:MAG: hypothetical protein EON65_32705 [archaeon]